MTNSLTILVTGATGQQGGAVARRLLADGHNVRAFSRTDDSPAARDLRALGAEVITGSFDDRDSLERAANGADAIFAMSTPFEGGIATEVRQGRNVFLAAKAADVGHVVYSSVAGANQRTGIPHFDTKADLEHDLQDVGIPYTVVAPVSFMENLFAPWTLPGLRQGTLAVGLPASRPQQQIALVDLASFVALVVQERDRFLGRRVEVAGHELTGAELAAILSAVSGHEISYLEVPLEQVRAYSGDETALMFEWLDAVGYAVDIAALRRDFPEVGWHDFDHWAREQDWSVLRAAVPA